MRLRYVVADVFTETPFTGNPLAVFPQPGSLDTPAMQRIAAELNLSETVFVQPAADSAHTARLRIFTPARELPFAGHPTVGTAIVLARIGAIATPEGDNALVFEEGVGPVPVRLTVEAGEATFARLTAAQAPQFTSAPADAHIAAMLGLAPAHVLPGARIASCGNAFLCVALDSREALAACSPDQTLLATLPALHQAHGVYAYWIEEANPGRVHARMFGAGLGIVEDPATGSAAAPLGALLATHAPGEGVLRWEVLQGADMGRPSQLWLEVERSGAAPGAIHVGGTAVLVAEGQMVVPA